jgi:hypothetical protein
MRFCLRSSGTTRCRASRRARLRFDSAGQAVTLSIADMLSRLRNGAWPYAANRKPKGFSDAEPGPGQKRHRNARLPKQAASGCGTRSRAQETNPFQRQSRFEARFQQNRFDGFRPQLRKGIRGPQPNTGPVEDQPGGLDQVRKLGPVRLIQRTDQGPAHGFTRREEPKGGRNERHGRSI